MVLVGALVFIGGTGFIPVVVLIATLMFRVSFSTWFVGFLLFNHVVINMVGFGILALLLVLTTEALVVILRPVTLTLRVFINIMIGHEVAHVLLNGVFIGLFMFFEVFVYFVQRYVFLVLRMSYIEDIL